ncbi:hypothetical protein BH24PSE2_BH24PSE2_19080 [soil metagenome]
MRKKAVIKPRATTIRLAPDVQERLSVLAKLLRRPLNQLINEAVQAFVERRSRELEGDLEDSLAKVRACRESDPDFEQAIAAFVDAEATLDDPLDERHAKELGPAQTKVSELLNG